ncbi:MAG: metallophosphoesterase [Kiritimatiellia bacterium]
MARIVSRRQFIRGTSLAVAAGAGGAIPAQGLGAPVAAGSAGPLIASAPVLQNAAATSMGVAFAVTADASGWVDYSPSPDLNGAVRVHSGGRGLMTVDDRVALIRLTGLKPATRYYYRIGADRISFQGGYAMKNLGPEVDAKIHSFTTLGAEAAGSFCVINDTHDAAGPVGLALAKIAALRPSVVIWNGDASNVTETIDTAIGIFLRPHPSHPEYAADTPYMFLNGNHDFRGRFNRRLGELMMYREPTERKAEYAELGRNFVQRLGDIALIGLDTGEDKLDTNPLFAGLFKMKGYREQQARWLAEAIETPAVKTAKFKVACCHIPLFDSRPDANPGDVAPADRAPEYKHDYAIWQRTCANLWGQSLKQAGVQCVIAGHQHRFRYDAPTAERPWAQIIGGGPELGAADPGRFPTVIEGRVEHGRLVLTVHDVQSGAVAGRFEFA